MPYKLRSLLLTGVFGFILPLTAIVSLFVVFIGVGWLPSMQTLSTTGLTQLAYILHIFGSGSLVQGVLIIGSVGFTVSVLFDAYNLWILARPIEHNETHSAG